MTATEVCLIGAGPSGVATAKKLKDHGIAFDCFEKGSDIGGNWRYLNDNGASASYASLHINTSKDHSAFSDLPMPKEYPDFPHHSQVLAYFFGRPLDQYTSKLGRVLPTPLLRKAFELSLFLVRGPQERYGVPEPNFHVLQAAPTVTSEFLHLVANHKIRIRPNLERLDEGGVVFTDGSREDLDVILYATGYRIRFPFLDPEILDARDNEVRLYRQVVHPDHPSLLFVGLVQPFGSIFPIAEGQARWVSKLLAGESALPDRATMQKAIDRDRERKRRRMVNSQRHTLQVLPSEYLRTLAKEMRRVPKAAARWRSRGRHVAGCSPIDSRHRYLAPSSASS